MIQRRPADISGVHIVRMNLFEHIFERLPDAVIVVGGDGRISAVNLRITPLFGYAPAELIGQAVELIENPWPNPKVTTPSDLPWVELLLRGSGESAT